MNRFTELAALFLKLGIIGFGGPAAHIAMMEDEVVERRGWMTRQHFLDLIGVTNIIPGPNSTEMTMHVGYERARTLGMVVAGSSFLFPAVVLTGLLAWAYVQFGSLPQADEWLFGIKPAVLAVIAGAVWRLGQKAVKGWRLGIIGVAVAVVAWLGLNVVLSLLLGGILGMLWLRLSEREDGGTTAGMVGLSFFSQDGSSVSDRLAAMSEVSERFLTVMQENAPTLWQLFLFFLKVGAILYGSGYVLVAFLEGDLVNTYGWLTQQQLLDAIAIGQFTPGPILSTATFIGFVIAGWPGAIVATLGIFLPSFIFVAILNPLVPRMRKSPWLAAFLDAINVSAVAVMVVVTTRLGWATLTSWQAWLIALVASVLVFRWRVSSVWIVLGGAVVGWLLVQVG
jgi:chromate transporter